jgi:hypothetical protein
MLLEEMELAARRLDLEAELFETFADRPQFDLRELRGRATDMESTDLI